LPLKGSPFPEKNGFKFQDPSCNNKKEDLFLKGDEVSSLLAFNKTASSAESSSDGMWHLRRTHRDAETSSIRRARGIDNRVWGLVKRTGNRFRVSMQLRKLSRQRFVEAPHSVIPNLFRDLVLILSAGDGGPLTDNVVFTATSGFFLLSAQRFLCPQLGTDNS